MSMFRYHRSDPIQRYFRRYQAEVNRESVPEPPSKELWLNILDSLHQANEEKAQLPNEGNYPELSPALRCLIARFFSK